MQLGWVRHGIVTVPFSHYRQGACWQACHGTATDLRQPCNRAILADLCEIRERFEGLLGHAIGMGLTCLCDGTMCFVYFLRGRRQEAKSSKFNSRFEIADETTSMMANFELDIDSDRKFFRKEI